MTHPQLALRGLQKRFGDFVAIADVDLGIRQGEFLTLLGPSGCGKTTLLRMIAGFEQPTQGRILLDGADISDQPPERRPFNMVFQSYALFPHMTVAENVAYGLRIARLPDAEVARRVAEALEMVGLADRRDLPVTALSGGQQQRVALVRALVNEPRVLLLDEPLGALDLQLRKRMQDELRAIQQRISTTFVYVTHDQEEALVLSHRIALMRDGRIVQVGAPADTYHRPQTRFVAEFVGEANLLDCQVSAREGTAVTVKLEVSGAVLAVGYHGEDRLAVGERGLVALRPEHLRLAAVDGAAAQGRLEDTILLGSTSVHEVRLDDGSRLRVLARDDDPPPRERVGAAVLPGRGVYVRAEESAVESA